MPVANGNSSSLPFRAGKFFGSIVFTEDWILETGFWNVGGIWKDTSVWID